MSHCFGVILLMESRFRDSFSKFVANDELDPIFTSYVNLADDWGKQLGCRFSILADESKVLSEQLTTLRTLSDPKLTPCEAGYGERTTRFPLLVHDTFVLDSKSEVRIQLADILAGATAFSLKSLYVKQSSGDAVFAERLKRLLLEKGLVSGLWPYASLGLMFQDLPKKDSSGAGSNAAAYVTKIMSKSRRAAGMF